MILANVGARGSRGGIHGFEFEVKTADVVFRFGFGVQGFQKSRYPKPLTKKP